MRVVPERGLVALLYMAGVVSLSAIPGRALSRWGLTRYDLDLLHIPLFTGLALVTLWAIVGSRRQRVAVVFTAIVLFAGFDEVLQLWVPGRAASVADWARDTLGCAIGIALFAGFEPLAVAFRRESER
jgi:hypothetical protein